MCAYIQCYVEFFNRKINKWEPIIFVNEFFSNKENRAYVSPIPNDSSYICNILADVDAIVYSTIDDELRGFPEDASNFVKDRFNEAMNTGRSFNHSWYTLKELVEWHKDKKNFKSENYKEIKALYGKEYLKKIKKNDMEVRKDFKKIIDNIRFMMDNCYIICSDYDVRLVFWFIDN